MKFILFIVIMAFAFALGVKFSDSFKNTTGNLESDELIIKDEMKKAFSNETSDEVYSVEEEVANNEEPLAQEENPLSEEEKNEVKNIDSPDFEDITVIEPMNNVDNAEMNVFIEETSNDNNSQKVQNNEDTKNIENSENADTTENAKIVEQDTNNSDTQIQSNHSIQMQQSFNSTENQNVQQETTIQE